MNQPFRFSGSNAFLNPTLLFILFLTTTAFGQTTAFNFQGRLSNTGRPVNNRHDLQFTVYGSTAGNDLISGPLIADNVPVKEGVFNCRLDFGEQVFNGSPRWMQISVRPSGATIFTNLSPRVELTATPYAVRARKAAEATTVADGAAVKSLNNLKDNVTLSAGPNVTITSTGNTLTIGSTAAGGGGWSTHNGNTYYNTGFVGIGLTNPTSRLEIAGQNALKITGFQPVLSLVDTSTAFNYRTAIQTVDGDLNLFTGRYMNNSDPSGFLQLNNNGNVGIGTATPSTKLEVRGSLTLEAGQNAALYTGIGNAELNRYLNIFNTPTAPSASGLKAGGLLISDSYAFANPGKNDLIVKGSVGIGEASPAHKLHITGEGWTGSSIGITGNATQNRDKGGWVKAMAKVNADGTIARQFSAFGGTIAVLYEQGAYFVAFPFQINDRYISVTAFDNSSVGPVIANVVLDCTECGSNTTVVYMSDRNDSELHFPIRNEFFIFVY